MAVEVRQTVRRLGDHDDSTRFDDPLGQSQRFDALVDRLMFEKCEEQHDVDRRRSMLTLNG